MTRAVRCPQQRCESIRDTQGCPSSMGTRQSREKEGKLEIGHYYLELFEVLVEADPKSPSKPSGLTLMVPARCSQPRVRGLRRALGCCRGCLPLQRSGLQSKCLHCTPCPGALEEPAGLVNRGPAGGLSVLGPSRHAVRSAERNLSGGSWPTRLG